MLQRFFPDLRKKENALRLIVLLGLAGLALILLSSFGTKEKAAPETEAPVPLAQEAYREALEEELCTILTSIEGVGRVKVLVTLGKSAEYQYAQQGDRRISGDTVQTSCTYVTVGSSREALLESVAVPSVTGVIVVCEGGGSSSVQEQVCQAVSVACALPYIQICVTRLRPGD